MTNEEELSEKKTLAIEAPCQKKVTTKDGRDNGALAKLDFPVPQSDATQSDCGGTVSRSVSQTVAGTLVLPE